MTEEQFVEKMLEIDKKAKDAKNKLHEEYAMANSPYKIGDIIFDHMWCIKIETINFACQYMEIYPECVYNGWRYTKKGIPAKVKARCSVWQSNVKGVINE
jgi:hypothetical protein